MTLVNDTTLRQRQALLILRSQDLRTSMIENAKVLQKPILLVDSLQRVVKCIYQHRLALSAAMASITVIKPHWVKHCVRFAWGGYWVWRRLRS